jgi:geranylgeranyl diphosphate synthase type II
MTARRPPVAPQVPAAVEAFLGEAKRWMDAHLAQVLPAPRSLPGKLAEAMRYSVLAGGKRLRPAIALAAAHAAGGRDADVLPFAAALELVHTYSLVHDDLPAMDDDDLRRGRPTNHVVFGEALAILAADALHTLAFGHLLEGTSDAAVARDLGAMLSRAAGPAGMVGGQVDDLAAERSEPDAERLARIHRAKTAALIATAAAGGARAAGALPEVVAAFHDYGLHLGLAFQIVDDVLDETGTAAELGKTPGKDRRGGKMTYVALDGVLGARARAMHEMAAACSAIEPHDTFGLLAGLATYVVSRTR